MHRPLPARLARAASALVPTSLRRAWHELRGAPPRQQRGLYKAASISRLNADSIFATRSIDHELREGLRRMRARARAVAANSSFGKYFLSLLTTNVVGPRGLTSRAQVRDAAENLQKGVNDQIDRVWKDWATHPVTLDRKLTLVMAEHLALETLAADGEVFVRMVRGAKNPHAFALQLIDADCLDETYNRPAGRGQNEIRMGVEVDANGAAVGYWFWEFADSSGLPLARRRYFAPAYDPFTRQGEVLHLHLPHRINQTRGVTWFHAVIERLHQLEAYGEAELYGARVGASAMGFIEPGEDSEDPDDVPPVGAEAAEGAEGSTAAALARPRATRGEEIETAPGLWYRLHHGEKVNAFTPEHPTTAFGPFVEMMLRDIASGLGAQYFELANDLKGVNYTSSRTGKLTQWDIWRVLQEWWIASFRQPVHDEWLNCALLARALRLPSGDSRRYEAAVHQPRGWDWVDPLRDGQASALGLQLGITSRTRICAERGLDFEDVLEELQRERELAEQYGIPIDPPQSLGAEIAKAALADAIEPPDGDPGGGRAATPTQ